jgi:uncharacterized Ntn-hydrolase superfamily protein
VDRVAASFDASSGSARHLADRLIEALAAGQALGGDGRHGQTQSAAVLVADPRPGASRRPDGVTVDINVCAHPEPVGEVRRIYSTISEELGFRTLRQFAGRDVIQLKIILHALGYFDPGSPQLSTESDEIELYGPEAMDAVDRFRTDQGWQTAVSGLVDQRSIDRMWERLEEAGRADQVREMLLELSRVRR